MRTHRARPPCMHAHAHMRPDLLTPVRGRALCLASSRPPTYEKGRVGVGREAVRDVRHGRVGARGARAAGRPWGLLVVGTATRHRAGGGGGGMGGEEGTTHPTIREMKGRRGHEAGLRPPQRAVPDDDTCVRAFPTVGGPPGPAPCLWRACPGLAWPGLPYPPRASRGRRRRRPARPSVPRGGGRPASCALRAGPRPPEQRVPAGFVITCFCMKR